MISTRGRYALRMMLDLAQHQGEGHGPEGHCRPTGYF